MGFSSFDAQGYIVHYSPQDLYDPNMLNHNELNDIHINHVFCGKHKVVGALCPNCDKPLLRFLDLDMSDPRLALQGGAFASLPLFYCWTCGVPQGHFIYQLMDNSTISILEYTQGKMETDFPYEDYPIFFPESAAILVPISSQEQNALVMVNAQKRKISYLRDNYPDLLGCHHQVGGEPFLIQRNPNYQAANPIICPLCNKTMPFFVAIADDCLDPRGFTENSGVQVLFHLCRNCHTVSAFNQCD